MPKPRVTAGLICASGLPQAMAAKTPAMTARAHPVVITIQPEFSPADFFSNTLALTPYPKKTRTKGPMNLPMSRLSMQYSCQPKVQNRTESSAREPRQSYFVLSDEVVLSTATSSAFEQ